MGLSAAGSGWATPEEWEANRDIIANLYIDDKRKLKDVMRIMRDEHGFHATEKMYKIRLSKWGLQKYLRHQTPDSFKHGRRAVNGQAGQFLDRALPAQQQRSLSIISVQTGQTAIRTPRPMSPRLVATPDEWKLSENCIFIAHNYILGTLQGSHSWTPPLNREHTLTWIRQTAIASNVLSRDLTKQGFEMLEICFSNLKDRLLLAEPHLLSDMLCALTQLSRSSDELINVFLRYALGLCNIVLPIGHPVRQFITNVHKEGWEKLKPHMQNLLAAYWDTVRQHSSFQGPYADIQEHYTTFIGTVAGWITPKEGIENMQRMLERRQSQDSPPDAMTTQMIEGNLILIHHHNKEDDEAKALSLKLIDSGLHYRSAITHAYATLADIADKQDELEEAISWARRSFDFAMATWGPHHHRAAQAILELVLVLRKAGRIDEAKEIAQHFDLTWEEFCEQLERSRIKNGKRFRGRPSLLHIKGFHARFQQAFEEMVDGEESPNQVCSAAGSSESPWSVLSSS